VKWISEKLSKRLSFGRALAISFSLLSLLTMTLTGGGKVFALGDPPTTNCSNITSTGWLDNVKSGMTGDGVSIASGSWPPTTTKAFIGYNSTGRLFFAIGNSSSTMTITDNGSGGWNFALSGGTSWYGRASSGNNSMSAIQTSTINGSVGETNITSMCGSIHADVRNSTSVHDHDSAVAYPTYTNTATPTSFTLDTLVTTPSAPTLSGSPGNAVCAMSWTAPTGATSYTLKRASTTVFTGSATTFSDTGRSNWTSYSYTVTASNSAGTSADSNTVTCIPAYVAPGSGASDMTGRDIQIIGFGIALYFGYLVVKQFRWRMP